MRPLSILVVTEDAAFVELVERIATTAHAAPVVARSMQDASSCLAVTHVDVLLLDGRSRMALACAALAPTVPTPVELVVVVPPDDGATVRAALALGATALLSHPVSGDALHRALGRVRELRHGQRDPTTAPPSTTTLAVVRWIERIVESCAAGPEASVTVGLEAVAALCPEVVARVERRFVNEPLTSPSADVPRVLLGDVRDESLSLVVTGGATEARALALGIARVVGTVLDARARLTDGAALVPARHEARIEGAVERAVRAAASSDQPLALLAEPADASRLATSAGQTSGLAGDAWLTLAPAPTALTVARLRCARRGPVGVARFPRDGRDGETLVRLAQARLRAAQRSPLATALACADVDALVADLLATPLREAKAHGAYPLLCTVESLSVLLQWMADEGARARPAELWCVAPSPLAPSPTAGLRVHTLAPGTCAMPSVVAFALTSEAGSWVLAGRDEGDLFSLVHSADPLLGDALLRQLAPAGPPEGAAVAVATAEPLRVIVCGSPSAFAGFSDSPLGVELDAPTSGPVVLPLVLRRAWERDDTLVDVVLVPLVPAYAPTWLHTFYGAGLVVRLDDGAGELVDAVLAETSLDVVPLDRLLTAPSAYETFLGRALERMRSRERGVGRGWT